MVFLAIPTEDKRALALAPIDVIPFVVATSFHDVMEVAIVRDVQRKLERREPLISGQRLYPVDTRSTIDSSFTHGKKFLSFVGNSL